MVSEQLASRGIRDGAVLAAMGLVPREAFVPAGQLDRAYDDGAQSIGRGQTISQPYMVARMTESLALTEAWPWSHERPTVLDVGTGSGYQAAVLAQMGARVISIERDTGLADEARRRLAALGYEVDVVVGDGSLGYRTLRPVRRHRRGGRRTGRACRHSSISWLKAPGWSSRSARGTRSASPSCDAAPAAVETLVGEACVFVPLVGSQGHPD